MERLKLVRLVWCLVIIFGLVACGEVTPTSAPVATPTEKASLNNLRVELDVFSGRVNPSWELSQAEIAIFNSKVAALPQTSANNLSENLGYRGFWLTASSPATVKFKVFGTTVQKEEKGKITYYSDPNRELEKWLLTNSQQHVEATLYQSLKKQIFS